jgi:hypothetical protein
MDKEGLLARLVVGDIFHAEGRGEASLICIIIAVSEDTIEARTIATQEYLRFDRRTGLSEHGPIDSVTPLPVDVHNIMLGLDRKFRLEHRLDKLQLTDDEKKALLFVAKFYPKNQIEF